jgi:hypothetical protein
LKFPTIWRDFQEHRNKTATYGVGRKKVSRLSFPERDLVRFGPFDFEIEQCRQPIGDLIRISHPDRPLTRNVPMLGSPRRIAVAESLLASATTAARGVRSYSRTAEMSGSGARG